MRNIWRIFKTDMKHLFNNSITVIIVIGLVFLPSIFTWYNVIACWDAFGNTGNLTVAVANTDEGYESDLVPLEINVGDKVVSALRANDQLNWTFTTEEDAIDGAQSGRYYAAVVIPQSFSRDMMTFYSDEVEHANIIYYANEKKNAIAPKVTDQGADQVSNQVNQVFLETLSDVALSIVSSLSKYSQDADLSGAVGTLADHVDSMAGQMTGAASVLGMYSQLIDSSQSLISQSGTLLGQTRDEAAKVGDIAKDGGAGVSDIASALSASADSLSQAISASAESYKGVSAQISDVYDSTGDLTGDTSQHLRNQAAVVETEIGDLNSIISALEGIQGSIDGQYAPLVESMISQLKQSVSLLQQLSDSLYQAADNIQSGYDDAVAQRAEIQELADKAAASLNDAKTEFNDNVKPGLDELSASVSSMVSTLQGSAAKLDAAGGEISGDADSVASKLSGAKAKLADAQNELTSTAGELTTLSSNLRSALASGNVEKLREVIGSNPAVLASAVTTPACPVDRLAAYDGGDQAGGLQARARRARQPQAARALLRALLRGGGAVASADHLRGPWQHAVLGRAGDPSAVVHAVLLGIGFGIFPVHLHVGACVREPGQGDCRPVPHLAGDGGRRCVPAAGAARVLPDRKPVHAGDAHHQRHACGYDGHLQRRFLH